MAFGRFSRRFKFFVEPFPKRASSKLGKRATSTSNTLPYSRCRLPLLQKISEMSSLLTIASRVEAAVGAYTSVQDFADKELWKAGFERELVCTHLHDI